MRTALARAGAPLVLLGLAVAGAWPLIANGLPETADGAFHVYRLLALDRALGGGIYFPRILPDLLYGYGYPLFNFYPSLSSYLAEAIHLAGPGYVGAIRAAYALVIPLSGLSMYVFARALFADVNGKPARGAGVVAAAAYMFNPYLLITIYTRGALAEALAFPLAPLLSWLVRRLGRGFDAATFVAAAATTAAMVLMHSGLSAVLLPAVALYGLISWACVSTPGGRSWRDLMGLSAALVVGLGLSSFFWLPAALERDYVTWSNLTTGWYDFRQHFLSPADLLSVATPYPLTRPHPIPPRLGWLSAALALGGLAVALIRVKDGRRWELLSLFFLGVLAVAGMLPLAQPVWEHAPLLPMLSFPWRLFAVVAAAWSPLAGALVPSFGRLRVPFAVVLLGAVALYALPGLAPTTMELEDGQVTVEQYWTREFQSSMVGTTSANEYVPIWIKDGAWALPRVPDGAYQNRTESSQLQSEVLLRRYSPLEAEFEVRGTDPVPLSLHAIFFPGWRAQIDGRDAQVQPSSGAGLVSVEVPPGEHRVVLQFADTRTRQVAATVSLLCLAGLAWVVVREWRRPWLYVGTALVAVGAGAVMAVSAAGPASNVDAPTQPLNVRLANDLDLLAATIQPAQSVPSGEISGVLYWLSRGVGTENHVARFSLMLDGREVTSWEKLVGGPFSPTKRWVDGEVVSDAFSVVVPPEVQPGSYQLAVSLRDGRSQAGLGRVDVAGGWLVSPAAAGIDAGTPHAVFGDELMLTDHRLEVSCCPSVPSLTRGDPVRVVLRWLSRRVLSRNYTVFVHMVDDTGRRLAQHDGEPGEDKWPTMLWAPGQSVVDVHAFTVPADSTPGRVRLLVGVYFRPTMERLVAVSARWPVVDNAVALFDARIEN